MPFIARNGVLLREADGLARIYSSIAKATERDFKPIDYGAVAREVEVIEAQYLNLGPDVEIVKTPQVFCAATPQYAAFGFELDVNVLKTHLPTLIVTEDGLTRSKLVRMLSGPKGFAIVHLVIGIDPSTGGLVFGEVDPETGTPEHGADIMSPDEFAMLLTRAQTKLVVLATCNALLLAVEVAKLTNMAASDRIINGEQAAEWGKCFYGCLAERIPLFEAFSRTSLATKVAIRPIRHNDVLFDFRS
jgi:hypothetical protein